MLLLIIVLQAGYFFLDFSTSAEVDTVEEEEVAAFQRRIDSLKRIQATGDSPELASFNPNFITDFRGYSLGMSVAEIDRLHDFRAQGQWVNSAAQFQEVTGISDSLLGVISPYFSFPEFVQRQRTTAPVRGETERIIVQDLNLATAEDLRTVRGIGEVLSNRIINYRNLLKGFNGEIQLYDVYGLSPDVVQKLTERFRVVQPATEKQDLNMIPLISLAELPYFNYETAREIIRYRESRGKIESFEELTDLNGFSADKIDRIKLYLTIN